MLSHKIISRRIKRTHDYQVEYNKEMKGLKNKVTSAFDTHKQISKHKNKRMILIN